ncbi:MAG: hypothetical protein M1826_006137 [Phylliscum demangeonii]|nr:MAG: hypothetical protein M1826_006137 [Phylliscum demangeonii]
MPVALLPASAAAFAPRSPPHVVLDKVESWLTATLKRTNRVKRPLNNAPQHRRCLTDALAAPSALWTLCSLMLPKAPEAELRKDDNPLVEALFNYQVLHLEAYVVLVDLVSRHEVAFKLTADTIEALVHYHRDVYSVDIAAATVHWSEKEQQVARLQRDFVQAVNRFVYRCGARALEGMEDDGAGELLCGRNVEVKEAIMALFRPLLPPPPPPVVDVARSVPLLAADARPDVWWTAPTVVSPPLPAAVDAVNVVSSSPAVCAAVDVDADAALWAAIELEDFPSSSPTPSFEQAFDLEPSYYAAPVPIVPIPMLPFPSLLAPQPCSVGVGVGFGGFGWDRYQEYTTTI